MEDMTLVYGMRLFPANTVSGLRPAQVTLSHDGNPERIIMHVIEGTRQSIKKQLLESIDAFFELQQES